MNLSIVVKYYSFLYIYDIVSELQSALNDFVKSKTIEFHDKLAEKSLENIRSKSVEVEDIIKKWEKLFKEVCHESYMQIELESNGSLQFYSLGNRRIRRKISNF